MVFILFNAFGDDFQPSVFIALFKLTGVAVFEKGSPMSYGGGVHKQSGLSISLGNAPTTDEAVREIERFVNVNRAWLLSLGKQPVEMLFNVGITVGGEDAFVPCLELESEFLTLISSLKIGLHIYGYPTSDSKGDE